MSAKEWLKAQIGVWRFCYEKRDIRDRKLHPAVMPIGLAKRAVELFTHKGNLVLDPFNGTGTTLVACQDLERNAVGFDINTKYCSFARFRLSNPEPHAAARQVVIQDDARNIWEYVEDETVDFIFTSPPYSNLLNRQRLNKSRRGEERINDQFLNVEQYSQDSNDLGTFGIIEYSRRLGEIYGRLFPLLKPGSHSVINVPDIWLRNENRGERVPIHIYVHDALVGVGYELRNTIIWDRTNIVNRVGIFGWPSNYITMGTTFEYLLDFWKPL